MNRGGSLAYEIECKFIFAFPGCRGLCSEFCRRMHLNGKRQAYSRVNTLESSSLNFNLVIEDDIPGLTLWGYCAFASN